MKDSAEHKKHIRSDKTQIRKIGNSKGLVLHAHHLRAANLKEGDIIKVHVNQSGVIEIQKDEQKKPLDIWQELADNKDKLYKIWEDASNSPAVQDYYADKDNTWMLDIDNEVI